MPKHGFGSPDGGRTSNDQQQHLYLVLESKLWGFGFHALDMPPSDSDSEDDDAGFRALDMPPSDSDSEDDDAERPHTLPSKRLEWPLPPAFFHMEGHARLPGYTTAAFRTKIVTMPPRVLAGIDRPFMVGSNIALFDVHTREIAFTPESPRVLFDPIYIPLVDRLFVLSSNHFQVLFHPGPPARSHTWVDLPNPPFRHNYVASYGVYPDKTAIFVSVNRNSSNVPATYTFNTAVESSQWELLGEWVLPFVGRAHFNSKLDLWVGLWKEDSGRISVCAAKLTSREVRKGVLYCNDLDECHIGATLIYMPSRNKYCLVQSISVGHDPQGRELHKLCFLFRLTTFSLRLHTDDKLQIDNSMQVRYYKVPTPRCLSSLTSPRAFWM